MYHTEQDVLSSIPPTAPRAVRSRLHRFLHCGCYYSQLKCSIVDGTEKRVDLNIILFSRPRPRELAGSYKQDPCIFFWSAFGRGWAASCVNGHTYWCGCATTIAPSQHVFTFAGTICFYGVFYLRRPRPSPSRGSKRSVLMG